MTLRTFLFGSPVAFAIGAIAGWLAGFALSQPPRATAGSVEPPSPVVYARLSWHVHCRNGDEVYDGFSTPSLSPGTPNSMGGNNGVFAFVDRKRHKLIRTTYRCLAEVDFQGAPPP